MHETIAFGLPAARVVHCDYGFPVGSFQRSGDLPPFAHHFAFVGSPSYDSQYASLPEELARHLGVRFVGAAFPDGSPGFLADGDALAVPSIWNENSPLAIRRP